MADRTRPTSTAADKEQKPTTVLDPLRPAVVVRRRVYDATPSAEGDTRRAFTSGAARVEDEDESGPPSSINVARALASLRSDELQRVEELVRADDEPEEEDEALPASEVASARSPEPDVAVAAPDRPTLTLGKTIALSELAGRMGISAQELPAALVARGFYALDAKTVIPRHTARTIAELCGWHVEDAAGEPDDADESEEDEAPPPTRATPRSRIATKRKVGTKSKPKVKVKTKAAPAAKTAKRRLAR